MCEALPLVRTFGATEVRANGLLSKWADYWEKVFRGRISRSNLLLVLGMHLGVTNCEVTEHKNWLLGGELMRLALEELLYE